MGSSRQRLHVDAGRPRGWVDADHQVELTRTEIVEQRRRRRHRERELDVGVIGPERPQHVGVVIDCGDVDHADADATAPRGANPLGPRHEVAGERHDLAGVVEHRRSGWAQPATTTVALEQLDPDPTLEFGQALRQRRWADADVGCRQRPGRRVGDRDEVLQLADREVGETGHPSHDSSDLLHCYINRASNAYDLLP